jgi:hypothetical protein
MNGVRYIENETQIEVSVDAHYGWAPLGVVFTVTYPSGHRYAVRDAEFRQHFTQCDNQVIQAGGSNVFVARPTEKQRELQQRETS